MYTLKLKHHFDAAHKLVNYKGACSNLHGHRWEVEIEIKTDQLEKDMVVDFKTLKEVINSLDHAYINGKVGFNPTAENIARFFYKQIKSKTGHKSKITIWESPEASITYEE